MKGAIERAHELADSTPGSLILGQFDNQTNPECHYATTGAEIWRDTEEAVDILVAGVGTGGTITGAGSYLKEKKPTLDIIAVEPASSPVLSGGNPGSHGIQGIGAGFVPEVLNTSIIDEIVKVETEDALAEARAVVQCDGILVGISSGAALWAATQLALRPENMNKTIVAILPDTGERSSPPRCFLSPDNKKYKGVNFI